MKSELVIFGEVLFDHFPDGRRVLGGAPFNIAWALKGFGLDPLFLSAVGDDPEGRIIMGEMEAWGLRMDGLQLSSSQLTGEVQISFEAGAEPSYEICVPRAWDRIEDKGFSASEWIYHGSLTLRNRRSESTLRAILARSTARRFFDVNLRAPYDSLELVKEWMSGADWLKLNLDELAIILGERSISMEECGTGAELVREAYAIENVLVTAGAEGALIVGTFGSVRSTPARNSEQVIDTVGAGDAFSACMIQVLVRGRSVDEIASKASQFARRVCAQQGAICKESELYRNLI